MFNALKKVLFPSVMCLSTLAGLSCSVSANATENGAFERLAERLRHRTGGLEDPNYRSYRYAKAALINDGNRFASHLVAHLWKDLPIRDVFHSFDSETMEILALIGEPAVAPLVAAAESSMMKNDPESELFTVGVLTTLGKIGSDSALPFLSRRLSDPNWSCDSLGAIVLDGLSSRIDPVLEGRTPVGFSRFPLQENRALLRDAVRQALQAANAESPCVHLLIEVLGEIGEDSDVELLVGLRDRISAEDLPEMAHAFYRLGSPEWEPTLRLAVEQLEGHNRAVAIRLLAIFDATAPRSALTLALEWHHAFSTKPLPEQEQEQEQEEDDDERDGDEPENESEDEEEEDTWTERSNDPLDVTRETINAITWNAPCDSEDADWDSWTRTLGSQLGTRWLERRLETFDFEAFAALSNSDDCEDQLTASMNRAARRDPENVTDALLRALPATDELRRQSKTECPNERLLALLSITESDRSVDYLAQLAEISRCADDVMGALEHSEREDIVSLWSRFAEDESLREFYRWWAYEQLAIRGDRRGLDGLIQLLGYTEPDRSSGISMWMRPLHHLTQEYFGYHPELSDDDWKKLRDRWTQWWKQERQTFDYPEAMRRFKLESELPTL